MKKLILVCTVFLTVFTASAQRWSNPPADNTGRNLTFANAAKTLASTDSISPGASESFYTFTALTAAKTLKLKIVSAKKWDRVTLLFTCDTLTAGRVVTFSTTSSGNAMWQTSSGSTMTVKKSKQALIRFVYTGTAWAEEYRSVQY